MAYRSEVVIKIRKVDYELADNKVKDTLAEVFGIPENSDNNMLVFDHPCLKWYDEHEDVQTIMKWVKSLNEDDYGMIILGEDDSDIEYIGNPWDNGLSVTRSISW